MSVSFREHFHSTHTHLAEGYEIKSNGFHCHGFNLMKLIEDFGSPLQVSMLPVIPQKIAAARSLFQKAIAEQDYEGAYHYAYCLKANPQSRVVSMVLTEGVDLEISSANDARLVLNFLSTNQVKDPITLLCNGIKTNEYLELLVQLSRLDSFRVIPILDSMEELVRLSNLNTSFQIGIRASTEHEAGFKFANSRFGIPYGKIEGEFSDELEKHPHLSLCMIHFYVYEGLTHDEVYFRELGKLARVYSSLKGKHNSLSHINIGGGFPYDQLGGADGKRADHANRIISTLKNSFSDANIPHPDIYTEFGAYTVAESGLMLFEVIARKRQNHEELWYLINNSLMTNLPDMWAFRKQFNIVPVNGWDDPVTEAYIGGLSCDNYDTFGDEHPIKLPQFNANDPLYIAVLNTGAYQDTLGGYRGAKHCLIPSPRHVFLSLDENGNYIVEEDRPEQTLEDLSRLLGY